MGSYYENDHDDFRYLATLDLIGSLLFSIGAIALFLFMLSKTLHESGYKVKFDRDEAPSYV